jgi:signal transduction histidine kinase
LTGEAEPLSSVGNAFSGAGVGVGSASRPEQLAGGGRLAAAVPSLRSLRWTPWSTAVVGVLAAAGVGYLTSRNPHAAPPHLAVLLRVLIILALTLAAVYSQTSKLHARMGQLLASVGLFSALWLLNGSSDRLAFSIGLLMSGFAATVFAYLMLVQPRGRLRSRTERRLALWIGGAAALAWMLALETTNQSPLGTPPLLTCLPHCPANVFSVGSATSAPAVLRAVLVVLWITLTLGPAVLLYRRALGAPAPLRRSLLPVLLAAAALVLLLTGFLVSRAARSSLSPEFGGAYIAVALAVPAAVTVGLGLERLYLGQGLAALVMQVAKQPHVDLQALIGSALGDPTLRIAYERPGLATYVDSMGAPVDPRRPANDRAVTWIERGERPVAAVIYNRELSDQESFIQAAGAAALMRLEQTRLEADLAASTKELEGSRVRLVETAHAERRRLERDLHDGVQQQLVGLRIKLDLATEALKQEPAQGDRLLRSVGRQMDDVLQSLRTLARGIYPSLLHERGLGEALKSAARSCPMPVSVRMFELARYPEDTEVALYYCCLEALQNVAKHAGPGAQTILTLWTNRSRLCFEVRDSGTGFDPNNSPSGSGLINMRDRVEAVGGTVTVVSSFGRGTSVRGSVPIP